MAVQDRLYTAQGLADMPDDGKIYELHNGVIVEVPGSKLLQSQLAALLIYFLVNHIRQHNLGGTVTGADGAVILNRFNTLIPDAAYISAERLRRRI